jgi:sugar phosphate isomerase/epimerase
MQAWMGRAAGLGFEGLSLWTAHCYYHDVTDAQAAQVRAVAAQAKLPIYAYAGGFGRSPLCPGVEDSPEANWRRTFQVAKQLGAGWLAGGYGRRQDLPLIGDLCRQHGMKLAFENHPDEKSAEDILKRIAGGEGFMGVAFDTGWAGTCGFDAPAAIRSLGPRLLEVHLKDVREAGKHDTCALGDGIVGIQACVEALREAGYDGWLTIEHEPYDRDPFPELEISLQRLRRWLG